MEGINKYRKSGGEYFDTGRTYEATLLGTVDITGAKYSQLLNEIRNPERPGYLTREQAIRLVKESQAGDPENPDRPFLKDLTIEVKDILDEKGIEAEVLAYTAVGTPLDHLHGVDAFIEAKIGGRKFIFTIDVTRSKEKVSSGHKADLIVGRLPDPTADDKEEERYLKAISGFAEKAADSIIKRARKDEREAGLRRRLYEPRQADGPSIDDRP